MNDQEYITFLISALKERENMFSKGVDVEAVKHVYHSVVSPILKLGEHPSFANDSDRKKFVIETFALACYSKDNQITSWEYDPVLPGSAKTPDFFINGSYYLEVYSPVSDLPKEMVEDLNRQTNEGKLVANTGFHPVSSFWQQVGKPYLEKKSQKYKDYQMTFLVHTMAGGFPVDMINMLKQVALATPDHHIGFYQGNNKKFYR
jgi:hypothetical protein